MSAARCPACDVAVVGAGPYGLSIAAHLNTTSLHVRVFGRPMNSWHVHAPKGMRLKSEGFASDLYAPRTRFRLSEFCAERAIPYADVGAPVAVETFVDYGLAFQRRFVPGVEDRRLIGLEPVANGFRLHFDDGTPVEAWKVVLATGLEHYTRVPPVLAGLPETMVSHSWHCGGFDGFGGREVVVVGAGASALNSAATLLQGGAAVTVLARKDVIDFHEPPVPQPRPLSQRMRSPQTGLGTGWQSWLFTHAPLLFRRLPQGFRHELVRQHLGPAGGWVLRDQVVGKVRLRTGTTVIGAEQRGSGVLLDLAGPGGERSSMSADYVVAATGFDIDVSRLPFLAPDLLAGLRTEDRKPVLSTNFESSVPGLYFVGTAASASFGPLLRFAFGARFAANRITRHLAPVAPVAAQAGFHPASQLSALKT